MPTIGEGLIDIPIPAGSSSTDIISPKGIQPISASIINGLASDMQSDPITYSNPASASFAKVILFLDVVTPVGLPSTVGITDGVSEYKIEVLNTTSSKRIEFNNIPSSFLASFSVINALGVAFPASNNSIIIAPM
jgi:hypothetical protein